MEATRACLSKRKEIVKEIVLISVSSELYYTLCRSRAKLPLVNNWKDGLWGKLWLTTEGQCDE